MTFFANDLALLPAAGAGFVGFGEIMNDPLTRQVLGQALASATAGTTRGAPLKGRHRSRFVRRRWRFKPREQHQLLVKPGQLGLEVNQLPALRGNHGMACRDVFG